MSLFNTTSHEAAMTTGAFDHSSPDDVGPDLATASPTTDASNATMTLVGLNKPDQSNNPFHYVSMYFNMISVLVGLVLNILCIVVFIKSKIARTSTAVEIIFLALADNINLITFFVVSSSIWSQFSDMPNLTTIKRVMCAGPFYFGLVGLLLYGMTMSVATIERFCCVTFPLKVKAWNLFRKSKMLLLVLLVISLVLPVFHFWCYELFILNDELSVCLTTSITPSKMCTISRIIVMIILANFIPGFVILVFSILTGVGLYRSRARRQEMSVSSNSSSSSSNNNNNTNENREFRITTMLLAEATIFFISRVPFSIMVQINQRYHFRNPVVLYVLESLSILATLNHGTNFVIYMIFLQEFRSTFAKLMMTTATKMSHCFRCFVARNKSPNVQDLGVNDPKHRDEDVDGNAREMNVDATDIALKALDAVLDAHNGALDTEDNDVK